MLKRKISPQWALLPVGMGTALSLLGDTSLYAVLPTHAAEAGVSIASVGILLSVNRLIRILLNGPIGLLCDRTSRRAVFIAALFAGACSTAIYGFTTGFWPLLAGRLLWGLAWAGIWVGGNIIILDISEPETRGRAVGIYQFFFFLGASSGAILGGLLTDGLGYHQAMQVEALLTLAGAIAALLLLPETRRKRAAQLPAPSMPSASVPGHNPGPVCWTELIAAISLLGLNRLLMAGVLMSTLGLFLQEQMGASLHVDGRVIGVATLTGLALGMNSFIAMLAAPLLGSLSDLRGRRWPVAAGGLAVGFAGFSLLAWGTSLTVLGGVLLIAISSGGNQSLATALLGDVTGEQRRGRWLGIMFTVGDLASAIGPLLAYSLMTTMSLSRIYFLSAALIGLMLWVALYRSVRVTL